MLLVQLQLLRIRLKLSFVTAMGRNSAIWQSVIKKKQCQLLSWHVYTGVAWFHRACVHCFSCVSEFLYEGVTWLAVFLLCAPREVEHGASVAGLACSWSARLREAWHWAAATVFQPGEARRCCDALSEPALNIFLLQVQTVWTTDCSDNFTYLHPSLLAATCIFFFYILMALGI